MTALRCPICDRQFQSTESAAVPFCSPRCRQIDLARWLDERYSVPLARHGEEEEEAEEEGEG
jgi:uncharacterized protein